MKINEMKKLNEKLRLRPGYACWTHNGVEHRRFVIQKNSLPYIISEDYEVYKNGEWVLP